MFTNTYLPHVGGVANSVRRFTEKLREKGRRVLVVCPKFERVPENEIDVVRIPAIQNFNGSDFSVSLPVPGFLTNTLNEFQPDIIHSHHPFLLGDSAVRIAAKRNIPLIFTFHTLYERYTHYTPIDSTALQHYVKDLSVGYANLCDHVIAPSKSIEKILREREVTSPISVIPTGVDVKRFMKNEPYIAREKYGIPEDAFLVGHVGRLAPEKNLEFLAKAMARFLTLSPNAHFLVGGEGPSRPIMETIFRENGLNERVHFVGVIQGDELVQAYQAMDVFAFTSKTETQGMVLIESMAASTPVIALDASGSRDVIENGYNGFLVMEEKEEAIVDALQQYKQLDEPQKEEMRNHACQYAQQFSMDHCTNLLAQLYESYAEQTQFKSRDFDWLSSMQKRIQKEWEIWSIRLTSAWKSIQSQKPLTPSEKKTSSHL